MTEDYIPPWKRELIERRRALGRAASVGPLQFTCPGVVSALRQPDLSPEMRLPNTVSDIQHLLFQIEADRKPKMGEEKAKKTNASSRDGRNPDEENLSDSSEEFKYGPGIVSKLKSKYLSLTLRETHVKVRPSLANMRRATSLENILDEPEKPEEVKQPKFVKNAGALSGSAYQSRRGITRNKENMKRARSVEALMRYNRNLEQLEPITPTPEVETTRKRASLEEKELPPPDLVKQTLRLFEPTCAPKPPPPPLLKSPSVSKGIALSVKPVISPKPTTREKSPWEPNVRSPVVNGYESHVELRMEKIGDGKFRTGSSDYTSSDSPRPIKDLVRIPADVEIIENLESAKCESQDKSVITVNDGKQKLDQTDTCNNRGVVNKEWSPLRKVRPASAPERTPAPQLDRSNGEKKRSQPDLSPLGDFRKGVSDGHSQPSPKPRSLPKPVERRQMDVPPPPPPAPPSEPLRAISPVLARAPPELLSSPGSQMKQVGVIRPIVTQKSPPIAHQTPKYTKTHSDRELEKNLLNKVKSVEQPVTKVIVSLKKSAEECTVSAPKPPEEKLAAGSTWGPKPNTMVFNFSSRKDVPDYIENDGLILTSKKDRPKAGGPGIVLLPGGTADSSTDFDPEEPLGPPSPCQLVIVGGNVLINGKSSLQKTPKRTKLRIKFSDEATTFEYPSESSMLEELAQDSSKATSPLNAPLRSGTLASYTPSQLAMGTDFQLGITRSQPIASPASRREESSDEDDYLRPADDASTVAWSAETAADLLF